MYILLSILATLFITQTMADPVHTIVMEQYTPGEPQRILHRISVRSLRSSRGSIRCEATVNRNNLQARDNRSIRLTPPDCTNVLQLSYSASQSSPPQNSASRMISDAQYYRIRLNESAWVAVELQAPQHCSISETGDLTNCQNNVLSPYQELLLALLNLDSNSGASSR